MAMNKVQIAHLNRILEQTRELITQKYTKGAAEHKTVLCEDYTVEELIIEGINENIDGITYGLTALEKLRKL